MKKAGIALAVVLLLLAGAVCASDVELTRHEWYQLYLASGKFLP